MIADLWPDNGKPAVWPPDPEDTWEPAFASMRDDSLISNPHPHPPAFMLRQLEELKRWESEQPSAEAEAWVDSLAVPGTEGVWER